MKKYTEDALLDALRELGEKLGRVPTSFEMTVYHKETGRGAGHATYFDYFGSWKEALMRAGFDLPEYGKFYSNDELCQKLRDFAKKLGHTPMRKEVDAHRENLPCAYTYVERFGSWPAALEAANLPRSYHYRRDISDEELVIVLRRLADELGHVPSVRELQNCDWAPCYSTYSHRFGSWNKALKKAGFGKALRRNKYSDRELINILRCVTKKLGHAPSREEMRKYHPSPCYDVYLNRFGSFAQALEVAGVNVGEETGRNRKIEKMLMQLRAFVDREGRLPSPDLLGKKSNTPCYRTCVTHFGSWQAMIEALTEDV